MKNIHLVCGAHIDPVWLWQKNSGIAEAISTFRVAADFAEQYDGFVFNHNESLLYEWVEQYEPDLFQRIQALVKAGKWHIMGGWYLQPDCLLPTGESILRQIEIGNRYFMEKFSVKPVTAINFDSFGHSRGLVQLLKKCGYDSYLFMRPYNIVKERDFRWKGYDGSEITGHNIVGGYNTNKGEALAKIRTAVEEPPYSGDHILLSWGIGNHGGGPSRQDLDSIETYKSEVSGINVIHSTPENYFAAIDKSALTAYDTSMVHCMIGCYTSMARIKQLHRKLENELTVCEKMLEVSQIPYDKEKMTSAVKALLFSEFHDSLPGTMIEKAEEDMIRQLQFGREIISEYTTSAFFELCQGQVRCKDGEIPVMVFNPHPYEIETDIEFEFILQNQNWTEGEVTIAHVYDENGVFVPTQNEKPDCSLSLDWVKHVVFHANLAPMSINRFDCKLEVLKSFKNASAFLPQHTKNFCFRNDRMEVSFSKETGLITSYKVCGRELLNSMKLVAYQDDEDPWAMNVDGFYEIAGEFKLLDKDAANTFNGYAGTDYENVRIIEDGAVRTKLQAVFGFRKSFAVVTYTIPKAGCHIDISIDLYANDPNIMYRLVLDTPFEDSEFIGQSMFGRETLPTDGREICYQKWCALTDRHSSRSIGVLNRGTYGGCSENNCLNISVMRTPVYSAHPIANRPYAEPNRNHSHIDMGRRSFEYRLIADIANIDADAEIYNQPSLSLSFFPSGEGRKKETAIKLDNKNILITRYSENRMHIFNSSDKEQTAVLNLEGLSHSITMQPYEVMAFKAENGSLSKCSSFLE